MNQYNAYQAMRSDPQARWWMFLVGLGSATKVVFLGCMGISELVVFVCGPLIFIKDYAKLKREGFFTYLVLMFFSCLMMMVATAINHAPLVFAFKASAVYYSIFCHVVVFHRCLSRNPRSLGWYFVGAAISSVITIFAFNPRVVVGAAGSIELDELSVEQTLSGALFWVEKVMVFASLPVQGWYLQTPILYSISIPFVVAVVAFKTTVSGRSAVLMLLVGAFLIAIGRKSARKMKSIGRYFIIIIGGGLLLLFAAKSLYSYAAENGMLSEEMTEKYEFQTRQGKGILSIIASGRTEPIVGAYAALHQPLIGYGALPIDKYGCYVTVLAKLGDDEAIYDFYKRAQRWGTTMIPVKTHSHIIGAWVNSGIIGLIFWTYVLYIMYDVFRRHMAALPQWFGYLCLALPMMGWHIFFSPLVGRSSEAIFITVLLVVRAVGRKKLNPPLDVVMETQRHA